MRGGSGGTVAVREWGGVQSSDENVMPMDSCDPQSRPTINSHGAIAPGGGAPIAKYRVNWSELEAAGVGLRMTQKVRAPSTTHAR